MRKVWAMVSLAALVVGTLVVWRASEAISGKGADPRDRCWR